SCLAAAEPTSASRTLPTSFVLVMPIAPVSSPDSRIHSRPVSSPLPFSVAVPAKIGSNHTSPSCGTITVTPVRTGPLPTTSEPSPETSVVCPTRTPATSVIAFNGPGLPSPITIPRSRARGAGCDVKATPPGVSVGGAGRDDVDSGDVIDGGDRARDDRGRSPPDRDVCAIGILAEPGRGDLADLEPLADEQARHVAQHLQPIQGQSQLHRGDGGPVQAL